MKRMVQTVAAGLVLLMISASVIGQVASPPEADKQKQEELAKQKEAEAQKKKQDELTKLREYELQKQKLTQSRKWPQHKSGPEYEEALHDYDAIRMRAEEMSKDYHDGCYEGYASFYHP